MRKVANLLLSTAVALTLVGVAASTASAQGMKKPKGEPISLAKAQVIDLHCYSAMGMKGDMHKECNIACSKVGVPLGLLSQDGKVYIPIAKTPMTSQKTFNDKLQPYAEGFVNVKGNLFERSGVLGIEITEVKPASS